MNKIPPHLALQMQIYKEDDIEYDGLFIYSNIDANSNKMFKISLYKHKELNMFYLLTINGRVKHRNSTDYDKMQTIASKDEALFIFNSMVSEKTGRTFTSIKKDKLDDKSDKLDDKSDISKYVYIPEINTQVVNVVEEHIKTNISDGVYRLLSELQGIYTEEKEIKYKELQKNLSIKINTDNLSLGSQTLTDIKNIIIKYNTTGVIHALDVATTDDKTILKELSKKFFSIIPICNSKLTYIDTINEINKMFDIIDYYNTNSELINDKITRETPIYVLYDKLNYTIEELSPVSKIWQLIEKNISRTSASKVTAIYELHKKNTTMNNTVGNIALLWHGTQSRSVLGILSSELKVSLAKHGMFNNGIYFANVFCKSYGYCDHINGSYLFLSEVSLGRQELHTLGSSNLVLNTNKYDSVYALGTNTVVDGSNVHIYKNASNNDVSFYMNKLSQRNSKKTYALNYDEYIIYNNNQSVLKYIVKIK